MPKRVRPYDDKARARQKRYYAKNGPAMRENQRILRSRVKAEALKHYGGRCACCGEDDPLFLTLDHIVPRGRDKTDYERKQLALWLKRRGFPEGFQVLCFNCNCAKSDSGCCPHQN